MFKASWDDAFNAIVENLKVLKEKNQSNVFATIGSALFTNEANYLLQRFTRTILGTNNIDALGTGSYSQIVKNLGENLGVYGMPQSLDSIEQAAVAFVCGGDVAQEAPIVATALRRLHSHHGKELILLDHGESNMTPYADQSFKIKKGEMTGVIKGLLNIIISE